MLKNRTLNCKRCERNQVKPNLRYYSGTCLNKTITKKRQQVCRPKFKKKIFEYDEVVTIQLLPSFLSYHIQDL
jgi:hypothetical protein